MQEKLEYFIRMIDPSKTHIKGKLPFIWVFGNGAEHVERIEKIKDKLNPGHQDFSLYDDLSSNRAKFFQWSLCTSNANELTKSIRIPEQYKEWESYRSKYTNLVDFELDIISISQGAIIFSESIGSYVEVGMLSYLTELHKNILIVVESRYIDDNCYSFFNLGAIAKIRENKLDDLENIWGFENSTNKEELSEQFKNISEHMLEIVTTDYKFPFSKHNKSHISLLLLDLIDLFPRNSKFFYRKALEKFNINIEKLELEKILSLFKILNLIQEKKSGKNEKLEVCSKNYFPCISYKGREKPFYRQDFAIERSEKL